MAVRRDTSCPLQPLAVTFRPMPALDPHRFSWTKRSAASTAEEWFDALAHLGPMRVMITQNAGASQARIQAHGLTEEEAHHLLEEHGGSIGEATWLTSERPPPAGANQCPRPLFRGFHGARTGTNPGLGRHSPLDSCGTGIWHGRTRHHRDVPAPPRGHLHTAQKGTVELS